jgi:hypothetical protein
MIRALLGLAAGVMIAAPAPAQSSASTERLEVVAATDTTVSFPIGALRWVIPGTRGTIVDPSRHDELVGRFTVSRVSDGVALGIVDGLTTRIDTAHVILLARPSVPWYRQRSFWLGALVGAAAAATAAAVAGSG